MALVALLVALVGALSAGPAQAVPTLPAGFSDELVTPVDRPMDVAFLPGGGILIARFPGVVRLFKNGVARPGGLARDDHLRADVLGRRARPDGDHGRPTVRVEPLRLPLLHVQEGRHLPVRPGRPSRSTACRGSCYNTANDKMDPASEVVLIDNIPAPADYHVGADLEFGKDGYPLHQHRRRRLRLADAGNCLGDNDASRDQYVLLGKVLRITRDGASRRRTRTRAQARRAATSPAAPRPGNKCQETYAWGLRNPFRIAPDPNVNGTRFFINDVGEITWEEIDELGGRRRLRLERAGGFVRAGVDHQLRAAARRDDEPDLHAYNHDTGCATITGGAFVPKGVWPADYDDDYLYADFSCGKIWRLSPNGSGGYNQIVFGTGFPQYGINGLTFGAFQPKDALYYWFWGDTPDLELHRIVYNGADSAGYARPKGATPTARLARARVSTVRRAEPHTRPAARVPVVQPAGAVLAER